MSISEAGVQNLDFMGLFINICDGFASRKGVTMNLGGVRSFLGLEIDLLRAFEYRQKPERRAGEIKYQEQIGTLRGSEDSAIPGVNIFYLWAERQLARPAGVVTNRFMRLTSSNTRMSPNTLSIPSNRLQELNKVIRALKPDLPTRRTIEALKTTDAKIFVIDDRNAITIRKEVRTEQGPWGITQEDNQGLSYVRIARSSLEHFKRILNTTCFRESQGRVVIPKEKAR